MDKILYCLLMAFVLVPFPSTLIFNARLIPRQEMFSQMLVAV